MLLVLSAVLAATEYLTSKIALLFAFYVLSCFLLPCNHVLQIVRFRATSPPSPTPFS